MKAKVIRTSACLGFLWLSFPLWGKPLEGGGFPAHTHAHTSTDGSPTAPTGPSASATGKGTGESPTTGLGGGSQRPVVPRSQLERAGYILSAGIPPSNKRIFAGEKDVEGLAEGDVVYINTGKEEGVFPGTTFLVYRLGKLVVHPFTQEPLGYLVTVLGTLEVIECQEKISTAIIAESYNSPIFKGDRITSYEEPEVPQLDALKVPEAKDIRGVIVALKEEKQFVAQNDIVYIDRGSKDGTAPGDIFTVYRPGKVVEELALEQRQLPQIELGEMVVISTREQTATALITYSLSEMQAGDRVVYKYQPSK